MSQDTQYTTQCSSVSVRCGVLDAISLRLRKLQDVFGIQVIGLLKVVHAPHPRSAPQIRHDPGPRHQMAVDAMRRAATAERAVARVAACNRIVAAMPPAELAFVRAAPTAVKDCHGCWTVVWPS